ncbi:CDP-glycerol glycerophosphotransferase family protein, partial [Vibrio lentus]
PNNYKIFRSLFKLLLLFFKVRSRIRSSLKKQISTQKKRLAGIFYRLSCKLLSIKEIAVFESYWGAQYSCNPKAISDYMKEHHGIKVVWSVNNRELYNDSKVEFVERMSMKYFYYLSVARYFVNNVNFPDFFVKRDGTTHVQTQHGTPLKLMGFDERRHVKAPNRHFLGIRHRSSRWDYLLSSNEHSSETWKQCFPFNYKVVECGYPRNDILVNEGNNQSLIASIKLKLGIDTGDKRKLVLYMPTWRDNGNESIINLELLSSRLGNEYIVLYRKHHLAKAIIAEDDGIIDVSKYQEINDLYITSDLLITDYSSSMFDYALLKKPIILFLPDYEDYIKTRGVYFDIRDIPPGEVAYDQESLFRCLHDNEYSSISSQEKLKLFHDRFCSFDNGKAAESICKLIVDS